MTFQTSIPQQQPKGEIVARFELPTAPLGAEDLKEILPSHDKVARLLAKGHNHGLIAVATGYTPTYIGVLARQERVKEIVQMYREHGNTDLDLKFGMVDTVLQDSMAKLRELIATDALSPKDHIELVKVFGPKGGLPDAPTQVEHTINQEAIDRLREAAQQTDAARVVRASTSGKADTEEPVDAKFELVPEENNNAGS